jgi:ribose transport system substrate-binding protein
MKSKLWFLLVIIMVMAMLVGCTAATQGQPYQNGKPIRLLSPNQQHPVVRTMALGFQDACKDLKLYCVDNSFVGVDFSLMVPAVDIAINQGTSGIIAFYDTAVLAQDKRLVAAGIPSVAIHTQVPEGVVPGWLGYVAPDDVSYAKAAADAMGAKLGGKGTVATVQLDLNDVENLVQSSFAAEMKAKYPDVVVLAPQMEGSDPTAAIAADASVLQAHPEITGVFGSTGGSADSWTKALQQAGKKPGDIVVIGMDYTAQNLQDIQDGWVYACVGQPLYQETYDAVVLLAAHLQGKATQFANIDAAPLIYAADVAKYQALNDRVAAAGK